MNLNIEFKNTGTSEFKLESLDIERMQIIGADVGTGIWVMNDYARQKNLGQYVGDCYDPVVVVHNHRNQQGLFFGNEAPGVMKRTSTFLSPNLVTCGLTHIEQNFGFIKRSFFGANSQNFEKLPSTINPTYK